MRITLIRHGQTLLNVENLIQGSTDCPLNDTGVKQAKELGEKLKDTYFDIAYVSPLARTKQTALYALNANTKIILDERIVERHFGDLEGKKGELLLGPNIHWDRDLNINDNGIETINYVFKRCKNFLEDIINKHPGEDVVVVCHYTPFKVMHYLLTDDDYSKRDSYDPKNCQTEVIEVSDNFIIRDNYI